MSNPSDPFAQALELQQRNQLNAGFARQTLSVCLVLGGLLAVSFGANIWQGYLVANPPVRYFATDGGHILPVSPTDKPAYTDSDVIDYGAKVIRDAFTLDFLNYRNQMSTHASDFSTEGFNSYHTALTHSNLYDYVTKKKMNMAALVSPGVLHTRGIYNDGRFAWEIQYPVTIKLEGQTSSAPPQSFIFSLTVKRADVRTKPHGLEVIRIVTRPLQ